MPFRRPASRPLGREFRWLWAAYAVSAYGSGIGFGAFPLIAIRVLHAGPAQVSALLAAGPAAGALIAVPLGPWVDRHRKRPVMMAMDLVRCAALLTIPAAYALGGLSFGQLLLVSVLVAAAKITFGAASGANLKALVKPEDLLTANSRLESTNWTALVIGPPLGGAAVGLLGPVTTALADAVSYLLSACGIAAIGSHEAGREEHGPFRLRAGDLLDAWRYILGSPALRPVFCNSLLAGGLILATEPLLAVLLLRQLGFAPWQYTLAFGAPCAGGFVGSRLAAPLTARFGGHRVLRVGLVACLGVFNPVCATYRLDHTGKERAARTLTAWSVSKNLAVAALTALWGVLASLTSVRAGIAVAGLLLLATPLLLPRRDHFPAGPAAVRVAGRVTAR
jgi:hypothetical protein